MTLFVNKKIRKFRIAKKMSQKNFATTIGCSERRLCDIELGDSYPRPKEIEKINGLGAGIHPSIFSHVIQKITRAARKKDPTRAFHTVKATKHERLWMKKQLQEKGVKHRDIAEIAKCTTESIGNVLAGRGISKNILGAIAEVLGYPSIESMLVAARGKGAV
jgi:transcriptional regulator with XRE-family HTH domain